MAQLTSYFGLDFGYINDPSAFIHLKIDEQNKRIYFLEEYVRKGLLNDKIAEAIKDLGYSKEVITADSAEKKSIAEIRQKKMHNKRGKKGPDSVIQGIQFLSQYEFIVDERCVKLMELENYTWVKDKGTNEYINRPVDSYNHVIDACRYAVEGIRSKVKLKTIKGGL